MADESVQASPVDERLFQELRALRSGLAKSQGVPPYVIFHDKTLREMVAVRPHDLAALATIAGIGAAKLERYGEQFLAVMTAHVDG